MTDLQEQPFTGDEQTFWDGGITHPGEYEDELFEALLQASNGRRAMRAVVTYLERASKTEKELAVRLRQKGFDAAAIDYALGKARDYRLVDDGDYAQRFVRDRLERKGIGAQAIRMELQRKGIDRDLIDEAMDTLQPDEQLERAKQHLPALQRKYASLPGREARMKAGQFLRRKGFDWDTIQSALRDWEGEDEF